MASAESWRRIVASSLDWEQAHASLDHAIEGLAPELRGKRPANFPHSAWSCSATFAPRSTTCWSFARTRTTTSRSGRTTTGPLLPAPKDDAAWNDCVAAIHRETKALADFTINDPRDLTTKIPHGTGQTYLRTVIVAVDHTSYHVGQIIAVRRLLDAWPR